jgi:hypothetical protein
MENYGALASRIEDDCETVLPGPNAAVTFSDFLQSEGLAWASSIPGKLTATPAGELTYPAYNHIPVTSLVCEQDKVLPQDVQRGLVEMVAKESGRDVDVQTCSSGHFPNARMAAGEQLSTKN